jgi:calcineurin-like phosphoesterase family protein
MAQFFSADWHLGHERILELEGRPFDDIEAMNQGIIDAVNAMCGPDDELLLLGDVVMGQIAHTLPLLQQVRCHLVLIHADGEAGNHDRTSNVYPQKPGRLAAWRAAYEAVGVEIRDLPAPRVQWDRRTSARMSHYPYDVDTGYENRHAELRPVNDGGWLLHGHTHGQWRQRGKQIDVGVDAWGGRPVPSDTIRAMIRDGAAMLDRLPWR